MASGFTSHLKEGVLRIFIALKNPSPRPGLNPRPLGTLTSTLTTKPPRRLDKGDTHIQSLPLYIDKLQNITLLVGETLWQQWIPLAKKIFSCAIG
jgi:hypothetical protein